MPIVIDKSVNFLLTKFTPKAGQIYPRLRTPDINKVTALPLFVGSEGVCFKPLL